MKAAILYFQMRGTGQQQQQQIDTFAQIKES